MSEGKVRISFIGLGRVGSCLSGLFAATDVVSIGALVGRTIEQAQLVQRACGQGVAANDLRDLRRDDVVLIAVQDRYIEAVGRQLATSGFVSQDTIIFHCSGSLSSEVLTRCGFTRAASIHPIFSFASSRITAAQFAGVSCSYEGSAEAIDVLIRLFNAIGAELFRIAPDEKVLYHAACVFASNFCVAMCKLAEDLFIKAQIDPALAAKITADLAAHSIDNVKRYGTLKGLTGPATRADAVVIEQHLSRLNSIDPRLADLYQIISRRLLEMCAK